MSGDGREDESSDWVWAHILWQRRGLRLEEFAAMPRNVQLAYIASEQLAQKNPQSAMDRLARRKINIVTGKR